RREIVAWIDEAADEKEQAQAALASAMGVSALYDPDRNEVDHATRLLPSGSGWFFACRTIKAAPLSTKSGWNSVSPNPAAGACNAALPCGHAARSPWGHGDLLVHRHRRRHAFVEGTPDRHSRCPPGPRHHRAGHDRASWRLRVRHR